MEGVEALDSGTDALGPTRCVLSAAGAHPTDNPKKMKPAKAAAAMLMVMRE